MTELSEITTKGSFEKVTEGINEEPVVADGLIQCRGDRIWTYDPLLPKQGTDRLFLD